jgi:RHS repeat-associated protein
MGDQLDSTVPLTGSTGTVTGTWIYNAYGAVTSHTGTGTIPLLYNSQYQDTETGLYYLRARYYDPATAHFLTRDPLEAETGAAYGYAGDEPLDNSDAAGLSCNKNPLSGSFWTQGNCLSQPVQVVLDEGRAPDYYTFCVGASPFLVIPSGCLTATKHRHVLGSVQDSVGIPGGSAQSRAGWIDSTKSPSSCEIDNFVNGASASANGFLPVWPFPGVFGGRPAVSETWGLEGQGGSRSFGTEVGGGGLGTHSGDVGQSRARHLFNF